MKPKESKKSQPLTVGQVKTIRQDGGVEGLDLRWNCRLTRSLGPTGARVIRSEIGFWNKFCSEGDFRFSAELDLQLIQKRKDSTYGEHSPESIYFAK